MILKVSNQDKISFFNEDTDKVVNPSFERNASDRIMDSLQKKAQAMKASGISDEQIEKKLGIKVSENISVSAKSKESFDVKGALEQHFQRHGKTASVKEAETEAPKSNPAEDAYNALYGHRQRNLSSEPKLVGNAKSIVAGNHPSDIGGPTRKATNNTILDPDYLTRAMKEKDSGEELRKANADRKSQRDDRKASNTIADIYGHGKEENAITAKSATITAAGTQESKSNYMNHLPSHSMSIFDTEEFGRLAQKTSGETISDQLSADKKAKASVKHEYVSKQVTSKEITRNMIDSFLEEKK